MINIIYRLKSPKFFEEAIDEVELDGVIVRPTYLSICQADQRYYQGSRPSDILSKKLPMALIHEAVGEVVYDNGIDDEAKFETLKKYLNEMLADDPNSISASIENMKEMLTGIGEPVPQILLNFESYVDANFIK